MTDSPSIALPQSDKLAHAAHDRLTVLDGWRAISILIVLAAHMLPLGKKSWELNTSAGYIGMAIFFTLSGFLITTNLERNPSTPSFFVRRLCRILPLAYLYSALTILIVWRTATPLELHGHSLGNTVLGHGLFLLNYRTSAFLPVTLQSPNGQSLTDHFWSLCVEIHFYFAIGLLMLTTRFRGWLVIPVLFLGVLALRLHDRAGGNIMTHLRVDEILSGACLALVSVGILPGIFRKMMVAVPLPVWIALLIASALKNVGPMYVLRSTAAACMVGHTLFAGPGRYQWLSVRPLRYIANVSYAVYVFHPLSMYGWLGSGGTAIKYAKRPLCFILTFAAAHLSTNYYETYWIALGRKWSKRFDRKTPKIISDANVDRLQNAKSTL